MSWEKRVVTGHPASDQAEVEQLRAQARAQGMDLQVAPLPQGGVHVRAVPTQQYGAPPQYGQQQYGVPPQQQYGAPGFAQQQAPASGGFGGQPSGGFGQPALAGGGSFPGSVPSGSGFGGASAEQSGGLGRERVLYLRKVYSLLGGSALAAVIAGYLAVTVAPIDYQLDDGTVVGIPFIPYIMLANRVILYAAFGLLFVGTLAASAVSRVKGLNLVALFGVSALMGLELAPMVWIAQFFAAAGETMTANPVRDAGLMVVGIFGGLTGYVFVTKKDFSYLKATLSMGFWVIFIGCILAGFVGSEPLSLAIASGGAVLSIGFLLYETSRIIKHSDMDDPVGDALGLLVQLRNLFMFILRILMSSRR